MRHPLLIALIAIPAAATAAPADAPPPSWNPETFPVRVIQPGLPLCPTDARMRSLREDKPTRSEKLGELPRGELIHAVWRSVDGCVEPVYVHEERRRLRR